MYLITPSFVSIALLIQIAVLIAGFFWIFRGGNSTMKLIWIVAGVIYGIIPCIKWPKNETAEYTTIVVAQSLSFLGLLVGNYLWEAKNQQSTSKPEYIQLIEKAYSILRPLWPSLILGILVLAYLETAFTTKSLGFINPLDKTIFYHSHHSIIIVKGLLDFCILLLALAPLFKVNKYYLLLLTSLFTYYTLLEGIRYRLFVLALCWVIMYFPYYWTTTRNKLIIMVGLVLLPLSFQLWSANRWAIANKAYEYLTLFPFANGANPLLEFNQTEIGAKTLAFSLDNKIGPDYGTSTLGFIAIRFTPKPVFDWFGLLSKDVKGRLQKPFPPLLTRLIQGSTNGYYYKGAPAYGAFQELFLAFGWVSCLIWCAIGWMIGFSQRVINQYFAPWFKQAFWATSIIWWYQWITRGYFPQQAELAVDLVFPLIFLVVICPMIQRFLALGLHKSKI